MLTSEQCGQRPRGKHNRLVRPHQVIHRLNKGDAHPRHYNPSKATLPAMDSCLSLLEDHVLIQAKPITISTVLDLSPPDVTLSCARRAMAQFALDHSDSVIVTISVSYVTETSNQLGVCLIRPDELGSVPGRILSFFAYSIELRNTDQSATSDDNQCNSRIRQDREQCLVTFRVTAEQELPMLIREPAINYPGGGPQRRARRLENVEEPAAPKRKIEEPKEEKATKSAKPSTATTTLKPESAEMAAFFARKTETSSTKQDHRKGKRNGKQNGVSEAQQSHTRKGVAVVKPKNPDRNPVSALSNLQSDTDSESSNEEHEMEIDDEDVIRSESDLAVDVKGASSKDEKESTNDKQSTPSSSPKKALTKKVVHHTYVQDKYLVTEDVVQMVETDVPDKSHLTSTKSTASKPDSTKVNRNTPGKGKGKNATKGKPVQTSLTSYFSKR